MKTCLNTPPQKRSNYAAIWTLEVPALDPRSQATVGLWILKAPLAHPLFKDYLVSLIHLREIEGWESPSKQATHVTHEALVFALDPGVEVGLDVGTHYALLEPINIDVQFQARNDVDALAKIESLLCYVVAGELSPDDSCRHHWAHLLCKGVVETATLN